MRYTGLAIAAIGVVVAVFVGLAALLFAVPSDTDAVLNAERRSAPDLYFPLAIAAVALCVGLAMYLYGGRGYDERKNPDAPPPAVPG